VGAPARARFARAPPCWVHLFAYSVRKVKTSGESYDLTNLLVRITIMGLWQNQLRRLEIKIFFFASKSGINHGFWMVWLTCPYDPLQLLQVAQASPKGPHLRPQGAHGRDSPKCLMTFTFLPWKKTQMIQNNEKLARKIMEPLKMNIAEVGATPRIPRAPGGGPGAPWGTLGGTKLIN